MTDNKRRSSRLAAKAVVSLSDDAQVSAVVQHIKHPVLSSRPRHPKCTGSSTASLDKSTFELVRNELNVAVLRGLRGQTQRVFFTAKVQISFNVFSKLKQHFNLEFKTKLCPEFLDEFHIIRAFIKNKTDVSKIIDDSFRIGLRKSRPVKYKTFKKGLLVDNWIQPQPYIYFSFMRMERVINFLWIKKGLIFSSNSKLNFLSLAWF